MLGTFWCLDPDGILCNNPTRKYPVSEGCQVILNGKEARLQDLRPGDKLEIDGQPAVKITAQRA